MARRRTSLPVNGDLESMSRPRRAPPTGRLPAGSSAAVSHACRHRANAEIDDDAENTARAAAAAVPDGGTALPTGDHYPVPPPPITEGYFPCTDCHADMEVNMERRELEDEHTDIELHHGPRERWCFDCHNPTDRDYLRLVSGTLVSFDESYRLCGQCHGPKYRDWRVGVHGKRTGSWDGKRQYLLCAHCHNPHSPKFKPIEPLPPPTPPAEIR
jgi:hypothetical protein